MCMDSLDQEFGQSPAGTSFSGAGILGRVGGSYVRNLGMLDSPKPVLPTQVHAGAPPLHVASSQHGAQAPSTNIPANEASTQWPS